MTGMLTLTLLVSVPAAPLLLLPALFHAKTARAARSLAPLFLLPGVAVALVGTTESIYLPWLFFGSTLGLGDTSRSLLLLTAIVWPAAAIFSQGYLEKDAHKRRYWIFFLLTASGNLGLIIAQDMISFYVFFTLMSFAAYGLIVHDGSTFAQRAGTIYLILVMIGEVLLFAALALIADVGGSLLLADVPTVVAGSAHSDLMIGLLVGAFGIKIGVVPLHVWLPLAHPAAPVPASAVLSGTMIKAGLLGLLQCLPLGLVTLPNWSAAILSLGLFMAFFGALLGVLQKQAKAVLAYSSISQMGFPLIGVAIGLNHPESWPLLRAVVSFYILHHGLAKGALFLGAGMASGTLRRQTEGRLVVVGLLIPALAIAGAPFTSGALAKSGLKAFVAENGLLSASALTMLLSLATVGTSLLMIRFLACLATAPPEPEHKTTGTMWLGWLLTLGAVVLVGANLLPPGAPPEASSSSANLSGHLWPLVAGAVIAAGVWYLTRRTGARLYLPPGDILIPVEAALHKAWGWLSRRRRPWPPLQLHLGQRFELQNLPLMLVLRDTDLSLRRLSVAGVLLLLLLLLLLLFRP